MDNHHDICDASDICYRERERTKSSRIYDILFVYMVYIYIYSVIVFVILYNL